VRDYFWTTIPIMRAGGELEKSGWYGSGGVISASCVPVKKIRLSVSLVRGVRVKQKIEFEASLFYMG
jgi:hypothetical protein